MKPIVRILSGLLFLNACRTYNGPVSDHFDGKVFRNPWDSHDPRLFDVIKWKLTSTPAEWPESVENNPNPEIPPAYREGNVSITFVNHATFLIEVGGLNILTDPIWSERTSPVSWAGPKRVREPGIPFANLPKIHAVLVSHNHYDHLDLKTLQDLSKRDSPRIFVPLGDKEWLEDDGVKNLSELDWWNTVELNNEVKIHFAPAQHWSARGIHDHNRSLWGSFLIEYKGKTIYVAGDTGYGPHFQYAAERHSSIEVALLPIGAYEPRWFMKYQHMNPADTLQAVQDLKARHAIGMHFGCWQLTDEGIDEPVRALMEQLEGNPLKDRFLVPEVGGTYRYQF